MADFATLELAASAEPVSRRIAASLRRAIVSMRVRPGEMLSEQDLATRFGVSRQPVREAFIKLSESGLVRVLPQRGTLVVKISVAAVEDARFVRESIECALVREAARFAVGRPRASVTLRAHLRDQEKAAASRDGAGFFELDEDFHRELAALAGRSSAWRTVEDVKAQMDRVRFLDMSEAAPMEVVITQHTEIVKAVLAGDVDAAERAMRAHMAQILTALPLLARRYPDLFAPADEVQPEPAPRIPAVTGRRSGR